MSVKNFLSKVDVSDEKSCWPWLGAMGSDGYGRVRCNGKTYSTHRYSYTVFKGSIPEGLCVLHGCRSPTSRTRKALRFGLGGQVCRVDEDKDGNLRDQALRAHESNPEVLTTVLKSEFRDDSMAGADAGTFDRCPAEGQVVWSVKRDTTGPSSLSLTVRALETDE